MNARQPDEPIPFLTKEERDALVLEFQRLAARLAQARLIAPATSTRLMRTIHRERRLADERQGHLADLVFNILVSIEDGTLKAGEHFARLPDERVAVHPEAVATALYRAERGRLLRRELRALLELGLSAITRLDGRRVTKFEEPTTQGPTATMTAAVGTRDAGQKRRSCRSLARGGTGPTSSAW